MRLGVYSGAPGKPTSMEDWAAYEAAVAKMGRMPDYLMDYSNLTDPLLTPERLEVARRAATTPIVTWQLYRSGYGGPAIPLADVAAGKLDHYVDAAALLADRLDRRVLIRFAHEMNGDWYPWGKQPEAYVVAFRRIAHRMRVRTDNVRMVWCPNVDQGDYPIKPYWPGAEFVDWMGLDGYNWGTGQSWSRWQSLRTVFLGSYRTLRKLSDRPIMIGETSCSETGGSKARWIRSGLGHQVHEYLPAVDLVVWYDRAREDDWRIDSSEASAAAFRGAVGEW